MKVLLYKMNCLTNMHVGSGDVTYSIIDNEIEKDTVLKNVAVIHPSGVKGALKSFFCKLNISNNSDMLNYIFGNEIDDEEASQDKIKKKKTVPGKYRFMGAMLMARPFRVSKGNISYVLGTSVELINYQLELFRKLGISHIEDIDIKKIRITVPKQAIMIFDKSTVQSVEGIKTKEYEDETIKKLLKILIGPAFAIIDNKIWSEQDYPMIARNCLNEQGISENLWYEEVVPHESIFYFPVLAEDQYCEEFKSAMKNIIQFGANASLGYGFATVTCIAESEGDLYG